MPETVLNVSLLLSRKALEARKHVLVEFPLATSASAVKNLQHLAASNGNTDVQFTPYFNFDKIFACHPSILALKPIHISLTISCIMHSKMCTSIERFHTYFKFSVMMRQGFVLCPSSLDFSPMLTGLVCHEEVISLLSDEHQALKDVVSTKPTPLQDGSLTLLGKVTSFNLVMFH